MAEMRCANCGNRLVTFRTERQWAGRREVTLRWMRCAHCHHVALENWSFADGILPYVRCDEEPGVVHSSTELGSS